VRQNEDGSYFLTDDGYIIGHLQPAGILFQRSQKRVEMLNKIAGKFGVTFAEDRLEIQVAESDYPKKEHMLIQAMLAVNNMFGQS